MDTPQQDNLPSFYSAISKMDIEPGEGNTISTPFLSSNFAATPILPAVAPEFPIVVEQGWQFKHEGQVLTLKVESLIGAGTFGKVFKARIVETDVVVAVKQVERERIQPNEEVQIMYYVQSRNVTQLITWFSAPTAMEKISTFIVMEYVKSDLYVMLARCRRRGKTFAPHYSMLLMYQLLKGIAFIHARGITHRDIKPSNVLLNPYTHELKICDFGSAKDVNQESCYMTYICSRFYRAPELLLMSTYTHAIDIWSAGCIFAEFFLNDVLFQGTSSADQIAKIIGLIGTPTDSDLMDLNSYDTTNLPPKRDGRGLKDLLGRNAPDEALDLLSKMLHYSPIKRISAKEALRHEYFDPIREPGFKIPRDPVPEIFDSDQERQIIPRFRDTGALTTISSYFAAS